MQLYRPLQEGNCIGDFRQFQTFHTIGALTLVVKHNNAVYLLAAAHATVNQKYPSHLYQPPLVQVSNTLNANLASDNPISRSHLPVFCTKQVDYVLWEVETPHSVPETMYEQIPHSKNLQEGMIVFKRGWRNHDGSVAMKPTVRWGIVKSIDFPKILPQYPCNSYKTYTNKNVNVNATLNTHDGNLRQITDHILT